jgi:hypothetical protein
MKWSGKRNARKRKNKFPKKLLREIYLDNLIKKIRKILLKMMNSGDTSL